jgi:hypothetical protein
VNGNKYLSLAEIDKAMVDVVKLPQLFKVKPVLAQAFNKAKKQLKSSSPHGDDYISEA